MKHKFLPIILVFLCLGIYNTNVHSELDLTYMDESFFRNPEKSISMDFKDAKLNDVLKIFSQQSGMNFIASSKIATNQINVYFDNVPVENALEHILLANDLTYELDQSGRIFIVKPINMPIVELITRVYPLKHATVDSSKIKNTFTDSSEGGGSESGSSGGSSSSGDGEGEDSESGIVTIIESVLSEKGNVVEDPRTNSLIVTDLPNRFPQIEQTIARLDVRIPQILIEVEMLDISKNTADLIGTKFGETPVTFSGASKQHVFPFDTTTLLEKGYTFSESEYTTSTIDFGGLSFVMNFLRTQTDTRNLARPRILTLNNEKAEIRIVTDEVIGTTSTQFGGDSAAQATTEAERAETGVSLVVTPQANLESGEITMAIQPVVSNATASGIQDFSNPETRTVKTLMRVNNGDTIVIGGLLRTDTSDIRTSVPLIGKIPLIGNAFRHKDDSATERELIVFITPYILNDEFSPNKNRKLRQSLVREHTFSEDRNKVINKSLSGY